MWLFTRGYRALCNIYCRATKTTGCRSAQRAQGGLVGHHTLRNAPAPDGRWLSWPWQMWFQATKIAATFWSSVAIENPSLNGAWRGNVGNPIQKIGDGSINSYKFLAESWWPELPFWGGKFMRKFHDRPWESWEFSSLVGGWATRHVESSGSYTLVMTNIAMENHHV